MDQQNATDDGARVFLKCVQEGKKLRVRIASPGFNQDSNCQFPRDLRVEGRVFSVQASQISIPARGTQKFFYRVAKPIRVESEGYTIPEQKPVVSRPSKVYEDASQMDCAVCLDAPKGVIFVPCGHYSLCASCAGQVGKCPLCRAPIAQRITPDQMD